MDPDPHPDPYQNVTDPKHCGLHSREFAKARWLIPILGFWAGQSFLENWIGKKNWPRDSVKRWRRQSRMTSTREYRFEIGTLTPSHLHVIFDITYRVTVCCTVNSTVNVKLWPNDQCCGSGSGSDPDFNWGSELGSELIPNPDTERRKWGGTVT